MTSETGQSNYEGNIRSSEKEKSFYKNVLGSHRISNMPSFNDLENERQNTEQNRDYQIKIVENESRIIDVDMDEFDLEDHSHFQSTYNKLMLDNAATDQDQDLRDLSMNSFSRKSQHHERTSGISAAGPKSGDLASSASVKSPIEEIEEDFEEQMRSFERQVTQFDQTMSEKELKMIR